MAEHAGVRVAVDEGMQLATLRYFQRKGAFAEKISTLTTVALPQVLKAVYVPASGFVLAWRSPTETLCLSTSAERLSGLARELSGCADGCLVIQSGGLKVMRLSGPRLTDLLHRLGGIGSVPAPGEARRGRLADVPVLAVSVEAGETLLIVERTYLPHLHSWIEETVLDFA